MKRGAKATVGHTHDGTQWAAVRIHMGLMTTGSLKGGSEQHAVASCEERPIQP